ncbi:hypothetical protein [Pelosinus sp. UFO1]|uniref:hypothetical protein n=1 Tax=Pelosinus sp. UFO1 TaxID=484770 RepID=UPI0004D15257|nr:hypothetical protein [Pelosinus sp. UFO1]AIF51843.1 hypothetical protein UFO1_2296 [Pelosinus sp. UFO1]
MKIKYIDSNGKELNLTLHKSYIVFAMEFSNNSSVSGEYIKFRLQNDDNSIVPYPASLFEIVSDKLSSTWIFNQKTKNNYWIMPMEICYNSFWEDFYNDEIVAIKNFNHVKEVLYLEELTEEEIQDILCSNKEDEVDFILNALMKYKCDRFVNHVVNYASTELSSYNKSSSLLSAFKYLSVFKQIEIDELFINYLTNIENGSDELTKVVNGYFS